MRHELRAAVDHRRQARGDRALDRRGDFVGVSDCLAVATEAAGDGRIVGVLEAGGELEVELLALAGTVTPHASLLCTSVTTGSP